MGLKSMKTIFTKRGRSVAVVGAIAAAFTLSSCSIYDVQLPGGADTGKDPISVHIIFRDVLDLVPQSTVKVDDVTVGKVSKIELKGYLADVTVELPKNIELPDNTRAEIRQTSLLGEKFVSLSKPTNPTGELSTGDVIPLEATGRNREIEEVFNALALLLNGGGVGQLQTISAELDKAFGGREDEVRSIITQLADFTGQLDKNKASIVRALENVNKLAVQLRQQDGTIKSALDDLPAALSSINGQRKDLVKLLEGLADLSSVGVGVIQASKESTIDALTNLAPVLSALGKAGDALPKSLQVALTYPFIDEAVGRDPQVARDLHMGDFTNLSISLSLDLFNLPNIPGLAPGVSIADLLGQCGSKPNGAQCQLVKNLLKGTQLQPLCGLLPVLCAGSKGNGGGGAPNPGGGSSTPSTPNLPGGDLLGGLLGGLGLGRTQPGSAYGPVPSTSTSYTPEGVDPAMNSLLVQGVAG